MDRTAPPFELHRDGTGRPVAETIMEMIVLTAVVLGVVLGVAGRVVRDHVAHRVVPATADRQENPTSTPARAGSAGVAVA